MDDAIDIVYMVIYIWITRLCMWYRLCMLSSALPTSPFRSSMEAYL